MRNLVKIGALLALVALTNLIALGQYRSGLVGLCRTANLIEDAFTNFPTQLGGTYFTCPATNVDIVVSAYNTNGIEGVSLTIGIDKSMDSLVWSNALVFTTPEHAGSPGDRAYWITNVNVGNYGFARVRGITNLTSTSVSNIQVLGSCK